MTRRLRYACNVETMSPARFLRSALFAALASASVGATLPACSSSSGTTADSLSEAVVRVGGVTDTALQEILSHEPDDWGWAGGVFDMPAADPAAAASVAAATPYAFAWHADSTAPSEAGAAGVGDTPSASGLSGMAYLLVFSTPSNPNLLRVFTSDTSFTPSASAWKALLSAGNPITVSLVTATFDNDTLTPEGGPHQGQKLLLTLDGS